jgi:AcrR family transcriptional regulator
VIGTVAQRREERVASIIATAWDLAREEGIGGVTLRGLARKVGIRQPSLYEYFDSKNGLYDAMFADGNRQLLEHLDRVELPRDPGKAVKVFMRAFVDFALEDAARCALLFHRPVPGFEPSRTSYEIAEAVLMRASEVLRAAGLADQGDVDCFIAMIAGLIDAQNSNDPGGDRWTRHLDRLTAMYLDNAKTGGSRR